MSYVKLYDQLVEWTEAGIKSSGWTKCFCPIHNGDKANAEVDLGTGVFHCFKCELTLGPEAFYAQVMGTSFLEASFIITEFRKGAGLVVKQDESASDIFIPTNKFNKMCEEWEIGPLTMDYCEKRGITMEVAKKYGLMDHPSNGCVALPYWWGGRIAGIKYRSAEGSKYAEPGSSFAVFGLEQLEGWTGPVVICEGESDCLRMAGVMGDAVRVVGTSGVKFEHSWAREFDGIDEIIVVPQCDEASKKLVGRLTEAFNGRLKVHRLLWKRGQMGKDVCDWLIWNSTLDMHRDIMGNLMVCSTPRRWISGLEIKRFIPDDGGELIGGLLNRREIMLVGGMPKARKTFLALNVARSMMFGGNLFGVDRFGCVGGFKVGLVEEEIAYEKLSERMDNIFGPDEEKWGDQFDLLYKRGVKMDEVSWVEYLAEKIDRRKMDLLILDPMQRLHTGDENQSGRDGVGPFWDNVARLLSMFPQLSIMVCHHMRKGSELGWEGVRGSSRTTGEVDTAIFIDYTGLHSNRIEIMGRNIDHEDTKFELTVEHGGIMQVRDPNALFTQFLALVEAAGPKGAKKTDLCQELGISEKLLTQWVSSGDEKRIATFRGKDTVVWVG